MHPIITSPHTSPLTRRQACQPPYHHIPSTSKPPIPCSKGDAALACLLSTKHLAPLLEHIDGNVRLPAIAQQVDVIGLAVCDEGGVLLKEAGARIDDDSHGHTPSKGAAAGLQEHEHAHHNKSGGDDDSYGHMPSKGMPAGLREHGHAHIRAHKDGLKGEVTTAMGTCQARARLQDCRSMEGLRT
eukprot:1143951-Pelagomonas_calceolata.AAC.6